MNGKIADVTEEAGFVPSNHSVGKTPTRDPSITALALHAIATAGPECHADLDSVLAGILRMANTRIHHWFAALHRPAEAEFVASMLVQPDFDEQILWDYLSGDPGKVQVRRQLAQFLDSDLVQQILVGSIRQGNHTS